MIKASLSGKNIKLLWSNSSEKRRIAALSSKIPRYSLDSDGDSILSSYEFPQESVAEILKKFDLSDLEIDARAAKVFNQYINESTPMEDLPPIDLSSIEFPIKPRDFQLKFLKVNAAKKNILLNMAVGAGKSIVAAYRCKILAGHNDFKLLIIAPKKLVVTSKWQREIRKCLERDSLNFWAIGATKRQKLLDQVPNYSIIITTYDQASFLTGFKPDFIVIDEAHLIRGEKTKRHKGVKKHITANPNAVKLLLTGTPRPSRLEGLWTLIKMVAPTIAGNKKAFLNKFQKVQRYMEIEKTLPSGLVTSYKHPVAFKDINMDELHRLISPVVYTVPKADITTYEDCLDFTDIEMLPKQKKAYYTVANEFLQRKKDGNLAYEDALLYTLRLRQIAEGLFNLPEYQSLESNKLDYAIATIDELDEDEKLIVWSCYQEGTNLLYERYKDRAVLFNGTVSAARTKLGVYAFNNIDTEEEFNEYEQMARRQKNWNFKPGEAQLLFGVIHEISSIGLDFQRECCRQQILAQSDLMATDEQALARVRRLGQESPFVYSEYVFSNNTMERSKMERKLENAKNTAHATQGRNSSSYDMIEEMIRMVKETL